jgi:hypothetical protein
MATVIAIVNGGYDACPSSTKKNGNSNHAQYRWWWFLDIYKRFTGKKLVTGIHGNKLMENNIDCNGMDTNEWCYGEACCKFIR